MHTTVAPWYELLVLVLIGKKNKLPVDGANVGEAGVSHRNTLLTSAAQKLQESSKDLLPMLDQ
jgi:hypothetical protein